MRKLLAITTVLVLAACTGEKAKAPAASAPADHMAPATMADSGMAHDSMGMAKPDSMMARDSAK